MFENSVFSRHIQGPIFVESHPEGGVGKVRDGLVCVVHSHSDSTAILELKHLVVLSLSTLWSVHQLNLNK